MKHFCLEFVLLANLLLLTRSTSDVEFEEDFVHSFLLKSDKLKKTDRLDNAEDRWIKKTGYKVILHNLHNTLTEELFDVDLTFVDKIG